MVGSFYKDCGLKRGDDYMVRIEGGCTNVRIPKDWAYYKKVPKPKKKPSKRQVQIGISTINGTESELTDPFGDGSFTYIALSLGELEQGRYNITVIFNGTASEVSVLDDGGEELFL